MSRSWAFCLEPDHNLNAGNFSGGSNPPQHGVFWVTGDVTAASPFTFTNATFFPADDVPTLYDGDQLFYAIGLSNMPAGQDVQDVVVTMGRTRPTNGAQSTVGSFARFPANGPPRCILNKEINAGVLISVVLPGPGAGTTTFKGIGPIKVVKDNGIGKPAKGRFESVIVARIGTNPATITAEFAFDPEMDVDNGI